MFCPHSSKSNFDIFLGSIYRDYVNIFIKIIFLGNNTLYIKGYIAILNYEIVPENSSADSSNLIVLLYLYLSWDIFMFMFIANYGFCHPCRCLLLCFIKLNMLNFRFTTTKINRLRQWLQDKRNISKYFITFKMHFLAARVCACSPIQNW